MRLISIILLSTLLSACSVMPSLPSFGSGDVKSVDIVTKARDKTQLALPEPEPIATTPFTWYIVTPENYQEVFKKLADEGKDVVLFALDDEGYTELAILFADTRNHINQQRIIIKKYKEYYESKTETPKEETPKDTK